ncbi:polynucleotide kinase-phosphatase [Actinocorallia populi]|uniref:polynucleotide kinase-phosphatase n=1 Tax=Actinocorallia populi TaxID=2079200 RepID=UPI000D08C239|nr:polynucleotide kinase-phosphatase [Actinocorallia populi]
MTELRLPEMGLVLLIGVSGSGKSHFAARHFKPSQVVSSDRCRLVVSDDENDQSATGDAFDLLHHIVATRLRRGLLTVVDATNVQPKSREALLRIARDHDVLCVGIVLDVPEALAKARNALRPERQLPDHVIPRQRRELRRGMRGIGREFKRHYVLGDEAEIDAVSIVYEKSWTDKRELTGPFDLIGDVHGCRAELEALLAELGYELRRDEQGRPVGAHHPSRQAVFLGDLVDRGPDTPGVLRLAMGMVRDGDALCIPGNHENKLLRALRGRKVTVSHGLAESLEQLEAETEEFRREAVRFMDGLISHYVLDGGRLVVAHAGLKEEYHGRASGRVRSFALYGETTGETDEYGLPVRYPWAGEYRGKAMVVYGHTPVPGPEWTNNTLCVDTGVVFGGRLTALRYPEKELVSVPAERVWYEPVKPLLAAEQESQEGAHREIDTLRVTDVLGSGGVETALMGRVAVREENAMAALEVMSRFAVDPRWLVYLPPTMAPVATSGLEHYLEHPAEAFSAYRAQGARHVVCEEKHMGSRAVVVVCRDEEAARARFGVDDGSTGAVHTRTGRAFFSSGDITEEFLARVRTAVTKAGLWAELDTSWLVLDCELLPWSAKAEELLRVQYAATGAAARTALPAAVSLLERAKARGLEVDPLLERVTGRERNAALFSDAYARYCWPTDGLDGVRLAPFQLLATEGRSHVDGIADHRAHLELADRLAAADPSGLVRPTAARFVDLADPASEAAATEWWLSLTEAGGEGMVVKPLDAAPATGPDRRDLVQPGLKVRGREYLRIIYGPDYTDPHQLVRLRDRFLGRKRSLALREYALGVESLARLAGGDPLWRVHQAVFAVLALESEPVDPRL